MFKRINEKIGIFGIRNLNLEDGVLRNCSKIGIFKINKWNDNNNNNENNN